MSRNSWKERTNEKKKIEPIWLPAVPHILHELELFPFVSVEIKENTDVHMVRFFLCGNKLQSVWKFLTKKHMLSSEPTRATQTAAQRPPTPPHHHHQQQHEEGFIMLPQLPRAGS